MTQTGEPIQQRPLPDSSAELCGCASQPLLLEIAQILRVSPRTIDVHRANICSKLQLSGSHSLLHFALAHREQPDMAPR